eukprot:XP_001705801.1 Hypothetical protein GL50803_34366 [Giardia lamblia ATCC 50803]
MIAQPCYCFGDMPCTTSRAAAPRPPGRDCTGPGGHEGERGSPRPARALLQSEKPG